MKGKQSALIITVLAAALWLSGCSTGKLADTKTAAQTDVKKRSGIRSENGGRSEHERGTDRTSLRCKAGAPPFFLHRR